MQLELQLLKLLMDHRHRLSPTSLSCYCDLGN